MSTFRCYGDYLAWEAARQGPYCTICDLGIARPMEAKKTSKGRLICSDCSNPEKANQNENLTSVVDK